MDQVTPETVWNECARSACPQKVVIHGAAGAVGSAVAQAFARRGAALFLAGRRGAPLDELAERLRASSSAGVEVAEIDTYDQAAVDAHADDVVGRGGAIDVMVNAVGIPLVQGVPLLDISVEDVLAPSTSWLRTQFLTARAAARRMVPRGSGTILMLSASPSRRSLAGVGGFAAACAAVEALTRTFAAEGGASAMNGAVINLTCGMSVD